MQRTLFAAALAAAASAPAQSAAPGTRLYQALSTPTTTVVDGNGVVVHAWPGTMPALQAVLTPDGDLLRAVIVAPFPSSGGTGGVQRLAYDGTVLWDYRHDGPGFFSHHDIQPMPSGSVLLIVWDVRTRADAIAAGRNPALVSGTTFMPDSLVEVVPTGRTSGAVIWEWHLFDHLIQDFDPGKANFGAVGAHPELLDVNYPPTDVANGDWNHANGIDYDPVHDWIVFSARSQNEIYVIDHSTTTAEAAGHRGGRWGRGGDFLYRWGNPAAYRAGTSADQQLFGQHDPRFVPPGFPGAGHVTVFNNNFTPTQSAVFELALPLDGAGNFVLGPGGRYGPAGPVWSYTAPGFSSSYVSSAQRLADGDTLVCSGPQRWLFEVTPAGQIVWQYTDPGAQALFQCQYVERSLWAGEQSLSLQGGKVAFDLALGSTQAGSLYLLLGSAAGTSPGLPIGGLTLPLHPDLLTEAMASAPNTGVFHDTFGALGDFGQARAELRLPRGLPLQLAGLPLQFAFVGFRTTTFAPFHASNAVGVRLAR